MKFSLITRSQRRGLFCIYALFLFNRFNNFGPCYKPRPKIYLDCSRHVESRSSTQSNATFISTIPPVTEHQPKLIVCVTGGTGRLKYIWSTMEKVFERIDKNYLVFAELSNFEATNFTSLIDFTKQPGRIHLYTDPILEIPEGLTFRDNYRPGQIHMQQMYANQQCHYAAQRYISDYNLEVS